MDIASLLGVGLCFVFMILSIVFSAGIGGVKYFVDAPSMMITFGGAFMAVLGSRSMQSFINGLKSYTLIFKMPSDDTKSVIKSIIDLSNTARKEGLLALEEAASGLEDPFMKKGVM
nr:motility protein A [Butyrivibrio sp.]